MWKLANNHWTSAKVQLDDDRYRPRDCSVDTFARSLLMTNPFDKIATSLLTIIDRLIPLYIPTSFLLTARLLKAF
jgi:hypothetical protein